jgi:hypothetical protein
VVINECHLTFTAADEYRRKLRGLVLLRNLGCLFVFLTGTLPPLRYIPRKISMATDPVAGSTGGSVAETF